MKSSFFDQVFQSSAHHFLAELSCYIAVHLQLEWTAGSVHVNFLASQNMLWIGRSLKTMPSMFVVGFRTCREKIAGLFIPQDLLKDVFQIFLNFIERI